MDIAQNVQTFPAQQVNVPDNVYKRLLYLFGAFTLLSQFSFLVGYYLLPEGFLSHSPQTAAARIAGSTDSFWGEFGLTLLFNLGMVTLISVVMNFNQIKGFPVGYLYPLFLGLFTGLIAGTNSFTASDITQYNVRDGMALAYSIGNLEMLGYICVIAATVRLGVYQYRSWWRWSGPWKPVKVMRIRDVRLSRDETSILLLGLFLVILGSWRETMMAFGV
jgi:hypothetical protein